MFAALSHRPLALAGAGALAGAAAGLRGVLGGVGIGTVIGRAGPAGVCALVLALIGVGACVLRAAAGARPVRGSAAVLAFLGGALAASLAAGVHLDLATEARRAQREWGDWGAWRAEASASSAAARDPPAVLLQNRLVSVELRVLSAGEDAWNEHAWLVGEDRHGRRIRCRWPGHVPDSIGRGALVRAAGRLKLPRGATNPGQRDAATALAREGIAAHIYAKRSSNVECLAAGGVAWTRWVRSIRRGALRQIRALLSPRDAGVAAALILGTRAGLADRDRLRFERTGTMHLLAISGVHLLLVAGMVHALARTLGAGPRTAAAWTLAFAFAYVPVAGAGAPVRRAAVVLAAYGIALVRGRKPDSASALGGAALLLVLYDPLEIERVGFWLSFLAAAAIAWLAPGWIEKACARPRLLARFPAVRQDQPLRLRLSLYLARGLPVAVAAGWATQPLVARYFGLVTPLSPLINLAAAPFITLLMPLFALVAMGVPGAAPVAAGCLDALRFVLDACAELPGAWVRVAPPAAFAIAIWWGGLLLAARRPRTGALLAALALACAWPSRAETPPQFWLLDVGHGQAALLVDRSGRAALIDAGSRSRIGVAQRVVRPALRALGIARLEVCVCTHADADHWNGIRPLLGRIPIGELVVGPDPPRALLARARASGVPVRRVRSGEWIWRGRGVGLRAWEQTPLDPQGPVDGLRQRRLSSNDNSLVTLVTLGPRRILLPADRQTAGLRRLLRTLPTTCSVMVAPHHGASVRLPPIAAALGRVVRPTWLLVSGARGSHHGGTLRVYGAPHILRTDRDGALLVELAPDYTLSVRAPHAIAGQSATIAPP